MVLLRLMQHRAIRRGAWTASINVPVHCPVPTRLTIRAQASSPTLSTPAFARLTLNLADVPQTFLTRLAAMARTVTDTVFTFPALLVVRLTALPRVLTSVVFAC